MKKLGKGLKKLFSNILHLAGYLAVAVVFSFSVFTLYIKVTPLDISYLIEHLKKQGIINQQAKVDSLYLTFDKTYTIMAKDIELSTNIADIRIGEARAELSRTSLSKISPSFKRIYIENANIKLDLDKIIANKQKTSKNKAKKPNYHALLKDYSYLGLLKWTKSIDLESSQISVIYNTKEQDLDNINLNFTKTQQTLRFNASGMYKVLNNESPVQLQMMIPDQSDNIEISLGVDNINIDDTIKSFIQTGGSIITGTADTTIHAVLNKSNDLTNIHGSLNIENGFVNLPSLYNKQLDFKTISSDFKFSPEAGKVEYTNAKLLDKNNNSFKLNGDFKYSQEPNLNITVKTDKIDLLDAFSYIPDLAFKKWLDENIKKGKASNVRFGFYGPIRKELDGANGNPYFDIQADFEDIALTYLEDIPTVENAKGRFNLFKKNINIDIQSATHSEQNVKRANVKIYPLFETSGKIPLITVKALSNGSVEDALNVLNNKLKLNQEELFKHYKGTQETQTTVELNLDKLDKLKTYNPHEDKFIKVDVRTDIREIVGIDPIFKQRFKASDAVVKITEDDFFLEASGFMNENPFSITLKEKLLEFGQHTDIALNANVDSFLIKDYLDIPSFNLSGLVYTDLILKRVKDNWNFDLSAELGNSLVNFGLLNYTKPLTKKGNVSAKGYFNMADGILNLDKSKILIDDFKADGYAKIYFNDLIKSSAEYKDIVVKNKTKLDLFSLKSNVLSIQGDTLDLRPFVIAKQQSTSKQAKDRSQMQEPQQEKQNIEKINVRLNKLYLNDDQGLLDVTILLNIGNTVTGLIKGLDQKNIQNFYLRLSPIDGQKDKVKVESLIPNFGNALSKTGISKNISSGFGILFGDIQFENGKFDYADLKLNIKKFQLLKAPLLAKALASISLEQLFSSKKGILFDDLYSEIRYEDSILKISNTKIKGPSLGILANGAYDKKTQTTDIKGTIVPVVKLNSVLSNIPVLGYILTGSQGAISGADFRVYGTKGKQKVSVSPLSIITPGIVKDLFESVSTMDSKPGESKAIEKARKKANIKSKE